MAGAAAIDTRSAAMVTQPTTAAAIPEAVHSAGPERVRPKHAQWVAKVRRRQRGLRRVEFHAHGKRQFRVWLNCRGDENALYPRRWSAPPSARNVLACATRLRGRSPDRFTWRCEHELEDLGRQGLGRPHEYRRIENQQHCERGQMQQNRDDL